MTIFYEKGISEGLRSLSEDESKHCSQVLRHTVGDEILIFDGVGGQHHAILTHVSKKKCQFDIINSISAKKKPFYIHLAIAPTKSTDRMEWMVEKLSEIGVDEITFIQTHHSERRKLRIDRMEKKVISAMKQSKNPFKLILNELTNFDKVIAENKTEENWIAHVAPQYGHLSEVSFPDKSTLILIGPEGDFSKEELSLAMKNSFIPISLGKNTLRTETAGFVACCLINSTNKH